MHESAAQAVLLVRAFEEADPEGHVLPLDERGRAGDAARAELRGSLTGPPSGRAAERGDAALLVARAHRLLPSIEHRVPGLARFLASTRLLSGLAPVLGIGAFGLGLLINELGGDGRVSLLPLLLILCALLLWNVVVYVAVIAGALRSSVPTKVPAPGRLAGLASRMLEWTVGRFARRHMRRRVREAGVVSAAVTRFLAAWRHAVAPLLAARARFAFHLGSMAISMGIVAGMVLRGIVRRYDVAWESTFLSADHVHQLSTALLGVAAAVTGRAVPSAEEVARLEVPGHGPAATWILLYGATVALFVVGPRLLLALLDRARAAALSRNLPVDLGVVYAARVGGAGAMPGARVEVVPYSVTLPARSMETLKAALHDVFGTGAEVHTHPPLPYGAELGPPATAGQGPRCHIVVVSTAQTPETEVHGRFLAELHAATGPQDRVVVVADAAAMRERLADPARSAERSRLWERVAWEAGVPCAVLDLGAPDAEHAPRLLAALATTVGGAEATLG